MIDHHASSFLTDLSWGEDPGFVFAGAGRHLRSRDDFDSHSPATKTSSPHLSKAARRTLHRVRRPQKSRRELVLDQLRESEMFAASRERHGSDAAGARHQPIARIHPFVAEQLECASDAVNAAIDPVRNKVPESRGIRKRQQIANMVSCAYQECLRRLQEKEEKEEKEEREQTGTACAQNSHDPRPARNSTTLRVVEFCAGSGHVAFPLLWVVLNHLHRSQERGVSFDLEFTILDMNADALRTAKARIDKLTRPLLEHFQLSRHVAAEVDERTDTNLVCEEVPGLGAGGSRGATELDTTSRRPGPTRLASAAALSTEGSGGSHDFIADFFGPLSKRLRIRLLHCMVSDFDERAAEFSDGAAVDTNASSLLKPIRSRIDVGIALHACGRASDEVMSLCAEKQASFVVAPCCVGRLAQSVGAGRGGVGERGEGEEHVVSRFRDKKWDSVLTCTFPRSRRLRECLSFQDYCVVAKAADWASHQGEEAVHAGGRESIAETGRGSRSDSPAAEDGGGSGLGAQTLLMRQTAETTEFAKEVVNRDRLEYVRENFSLPGVPGSPKENPDLRMVKMYPATCTPKNDILLASYAAR